MPRRKQGHNSKEIAPGGHLKKTNPEIELVQNESFKSFPTKNDLLIKFKKNATANFTSSSNNEKTEREYIEATKSLNDSMVSKQEINNNFVELPNESNDNEKRKDFEKSDIVFKDGKTYNCLSNIPWNFLNTPSFLNSDSSNTVKPNGNKAFLMVQEPSNGSLKKDYTNPHHSSTIVSNISLHSYKNYPQLSNSGENVIENQKDSSETTKINFVPASQEDIEQMNYAVFTSLNDNNKIQSKEVVCTVEEKQNCQLPSSIYGMPASTVDKMLINHYSTEAVNQYTRDGKTSFLQEILEQKVTKSNSDTPNENKYNPIITKSNFLPGNDILHSNIKVNIPNASQFAKNEKLTAMQLCNFEKSNPKFNNRELKFNNLPTSVIENEQAKNSFKTNIPDTERFLPSTNSLLINGIEKERFNSKLKINIPEGTLTDDSNSSYSTESSKSLKCPRITSPQILEQRINKIISNNIAIVDTVDVVWPKRYSKQMHSSQSYTNESESRKSQKSIPVNEEKSMSLSSFENNTKSKLHSALLGGTEHTFGMFRKSHSFSKTLGTKEKIITQNNVFSNIDSTGRTNLKITNSVSEEELKGSAIKSLLSLKQGQYSKEKSAFTFDKDSFIQHPQNPEGSIIKDLLLKSKSQEDLRLYNEDSLCDASYQMKNSSKIHKCSSCHVEFADKIVFEKHISICFKDTGNVMNILRDPIEPLKFQEISAQYKSLPSDHQQAQIDKSKLGIIKENDDGPILKKQLLMPLSCSPPMKRRKVSESVILPSYNSEPNINNDLKCIPTKILNNMEVLPHRSRSQSVHLFGGEVQVLDGYRTKKIKIQNLPGAFPTSVDKVSNFDKLISITKNDAITTAVVTIAQPVHNSGGTLHMSTKSSTSNLLPLTLAMPGHMINEYIKTSKSEEMNLIANNSKHLNVSANRDIFLPVHNKGFNIQAQVSDHNNYMNVLPGPSTDDCFTLNKPRLSPINNSFYSPVFSTAEEKLEASFLKRKENEHSTNYTVPTVLLTPSSPTYSMAESEVSSSSGVSPQTNKKFLAPTRPTSLPLKKKPITMVSFGTGTTLVSPETPRPKKSCVQLYLNGHAYTYLGLKCSTRSTYCCIYRPQPMFVLQETNPKLSMYSNWQVVPAKEELCGLTPGQMSSFYCSKQKKDNSIPVMSKMGEPLIFTHSSYWTYRAQDKVEQKDAGESSKEDSNVLNDVLNVTQDPITTLSENIRSESVITSVVNKQDKQLLSTDESSLPLDTENTLSDGDVNNSNDEDDDDDCQEDGTESLTDSSQPQPPKRVKIFEGGFKSNEDYTYVRGRGRGKYVCEECGIRCKKPSMLKKHIRTHTDLRPYKCKHCSFAFKTKGNLTKHMKSKAHHKKCTELGIIPVPTTTDDSQIDAEALAKQIEKKKTQFSDGEDADDDDDEDSDESDEECESDASSMIVTGQTSQIKMLTNGHSKKSDLHEKVMDSFDENTKSRDSISKQAEEHEAARSLLDLSAFGEPTQWSTSTGDLTDVTSAGESEVGSLPALSHDQSLLSPSSFTSHPISSTVISSARSRNVSDQWLSTETLGHRPRSYSADIPLSGGKQIKYKLVKDIIAETGTKLQVDESADSGSKEQYARRYSISVVREARKSRTFNPHDWSSTNASEFNPQRRDSELTDQPMDLSVSRDFNKYKSMYSAEIASSFMNVVSQEECAPDINIATSLESCMTESYQLKSLPVLSPQVLVGYDTGDNNTDSSLLPLIDDTTSLGPSTSRSVYYVQDTSSFENVSKQKDTDTSEDPSSPDMVEYAAVCSPVSPLNLEDSAYYYSHESAAQAATNAEDMPSTSRNQAEFIVPSTSSSGNMEEGKCVCRICNKMFAKSSHLRLHVNIHYFERPFRCDNCAVSFRTKGHLQKHKRSVSHYNKVNMNLTFGTPTVDNPRPFKCADCKIAFRIHGHLAKHLRSKMHIMKLECLGKLPFGMYAEMERSGVSLNEIDTTDCNNSLESLQVMAQKLYQRDSRRMRWQGPEQSADPACALPPLTATNSQTLIDSILPIGETLTSTFEPAGMVVGIPISNPSSSKTLDDEEVKQESSQTNVLRLVSTSIDGTSAISSLPRYVAPQSAASSSQNTAPRIEVPDMESAMSLNRSGTCHICGRHFKSAKFLQVHLYCDHPALTPSTNETSLVDTASSEPRDLPCDLCGKRFPNQKVLQQHLLSHAQPRPFVCEICDAGFTSSSSLVAHQATHQNNSSGGSTSDNRVVQLK